MVIATPAKTHYKIAKDAILSGKHILLERVRARTNQICSSKNK
ncbi:MAG: hypothetical protein KJ977_04255 [Candidatus Omnitrophica bacterium]|nr:hypothetical protein [Candidatus Omnitrophota bacterium]MBU2251721.1 hypothetical protein [Candidatus Omnitrophota bacterium]MBU2266233.1 hypothetical protein [Candidatus Omnitrophota bacterium]